jgi:hypothetical protein
VKISQLDQKLQQQLEIWNFALISAPGDFGGLKSYNALTFDGYDFSTIQN